MSLSLRRGDQTDFVMLSSKAVIPVTASRPDALGDCYEAASRACCAVLTLRG